MTETLLLSMVDNNDVERIWKESNKTQIRVSIPSNLAEFIDDKASDDWKIDKAARAKEVTKLILIAKEKIDEEKSSNE